VNVIYVELNLSLIEDTNMRPGQKVIIKDSAIGYSVLLNHQWRNGGFVIVEKIKECKTKCCWCKDTTVTKFVGCEGDWCHISEVKTFVPLPISKPISWNEYRERKERKKLTEAITIAGKDSLESMIRFLANNHYGAFKPDLVFVDYLEKF